MYRLFSRVLRAEPPQQHLHKAPSPPRCKAVSLQSKRSLAVQTSTGRSGSGSRAEFVNTRYWESFATWWQLLGEKREIPAQGCELRSGTANRAGRAGGAAGGSLQKGWMSLLSPHTHRFLHTHTFRHKPQALGSITPSPSSARHSWHSPRCPASSLASQLECMPEPRARITVRQHWAFCNLMLLYPNLFSWKKTKACWFYDVNPRILGV